MEEKKDWDEAIQYASGGGADSFKRLQDLNAPSQPRVIPDRDKENLIKAVEIMKNILGNVSK